MYYKPAFLSELCFNSRCLQRLVTVGKPYARVHAHMYICVYLHTHIRTYMHTSIIRTYVRTCIHAYMHTCIHAYMHSCMHAYMHTYIHMPTHTYRGSVWTLRVLSHEPALYFTTAFTTAVTTASTTAGLDLESLVPRTGHTTPQVFLPAHRFHRL